MYLYGCLGSGLATNDDNLYLVCARYGFAVNDQYHLAIGEPAETASTEVFGINGSLDVVLITENIHVHCANGVR